MPPPAYHHHDIGEPLSLSHQLRTQLLRLFEDLGRRQVPRKPHLIVVVVVVIYWCACECVCIVSCRFLCTYVKRLFIYGAQNFVIAGRKGKTHKHKCQTIDVKSVAQNVFV